MLRKIDCIMIRVDDVEAAAAYYAKSLAFAPNGVETAPLDWRSQKLMLK